jgi:hypothetical protein
VWDLIAREAWYENSQKKNSHKMRGGLEIETQISHNK